MVQLVSYNIQYGKGRDGRIDLDRIVREVDGADVVAMQEVDRYWSRSGMTDQVAVLAERMSDYHWVYGPGIDLDASFRDDNGRLHNRRRQFGNMLLSRFPIVWSRNHLLPKHGLVSQVSLQRSALEAAIAFPSGPVRVASVHLAHSSPAERLAQVLRLRELQREAAFDGGILSGDGANWREAGLPLPAPRQSIVLGDFNMTPDDPAYAAMTGGDDPKYGRLTTVDGYVDAWIHAGGDPAGGHTRFEDDRIRRIDFGFISPDLAGKLRDVRVDTEADGSDHQPLWLEMEL
jgi:endonuclease/exonuclease/phosphatase family metal-dependent hydrolase